MRRAVRSISGGLEFFFAQLNAQRLREETFYLAYHLHWSRDDILALETPERRDYVRMLAARIEADNAAAEQLADGLRRR
ncbi:MAG TPA: hypothetical protein VN806_02475 [Caulobacteraceae bacterium]|nr:hypothetical protein [Caulobacteraceae bacterium]